MAEAQASGLMEIACHSWDHNHPVAPGTPPEDMPRGDFFVVDSEAKARFEIDQAMDYLNARLPQPVLGAQTLSLTFYGGSLGVLYRVETSRDLITWTTEGVSTVLTGLNGDRTASVLRTGESRYLRLVVE